MAKGVNVHNLLLLAILLLLGHLGTCRGQEEIPGLGIAEYFSVSPGGHYVLSLERTDEFSSEGPFTFEMRVNKIGETDLIMCDTIADTYADASHFFWVNDSLLFVSEKGALNLYSRRYEVVKIPRVLEYVNYDAVKRMTIYVTADERGEVLNSIKGNKVKTLLVLKRAAFESEGQPAVILQSDSSKAYSYVLGYSEDSLEVIRVDSSGSATSPWQRIEYRPDRMYNVVVADNMCGVLSKKDGVLRIYRSGVADSPSLIKGVVSILAARDTLFIIDSTGLRTISPGGRTTLLFEKAQLPGQTLERVTPAGFYLSRPGNDVYKGDMYRGSPIHLYFIERHSVTVK